jgi:hypothetical protein
MSITTVEGTKFVGKSEFCASRYNTHIDNDEPVAYISFPIGRVELYHPDREVEDKFIRETGCTIKSAQKNMEDNVVHIKALYKEGFSIYIENWEIYYESVMSISGSGDVNKLNLDCEIARVLVTECEKVLTAKYKDAGFPDAVIKLFLSVNEIFEKVNGPDC